MSRSSLLAVGALLLNGCLIVPVPQRTPSVTVHRGAFTAADRAALEPGMSFEDVLLRLGEPDLVAEGGRTITYEWRVVVGEMLFWERSSNAIVETRSLTLEFDDGCRLTHVSRGKQ